MPPPGLPGVMPQTPTGAAMDNADFLTKTDELERLLNDPDVPMDPARIWELLAELAAAGTVPPAGNRPMAH
jgi:hypothetical protein